jgi:integration host factor subunit alpha
MTITRKELIKAVSEKTGFSTQDSADLMERLFEILTEALEKGEQIKISGFGNFVARQKRPRRGRNPQTGGEIVISGRKVVTFKASSVLRKALKQES